MLLPYCFLDGVPTLRNSEIGALFQQLSEEDMVQQVFYEGDITTETEFIERMTSPHTHFFLIKNAEHRTVGFCWFTNCTRDTCQPHWVAFKKTFSRQVLKDLAAAAEEILNTLPYIGYLGIMPVTNVEGNRVMKHTGGTFLGTIPNYIRLHTGQIVAGNLYYKTRED